MNNFFMLNETINLDDFDEFKLGMSELTAINKQKDDIFLKHESIYNLEIMNILYSKFGYEEQVISIFIEQLTPIENYFYSEEIFDANFPNEPNAFLGIDFINQTISVSKQICDDISYNRWRLEIMPNFDKLLFLLGTCHYVQSFKKDFLSLSKDAQISIIEEFEKSKNRQLITPFYPDTKIIKDVSPDKNRCKVMELRVYTPIALRVYFNESQGRVYLASIEQKSNPDQNEDIKSAHNILHNLISSL